LVYYINFIRLFGIFNLKMVYTRKQRGVKKTSKYGGRRNYRKGSLKTGGKRTMKNVGGGFSKCRGCLPPGLYNKNKFLSSDTPEQIEAKLNRMFDDETPSNILRYMLSNWANFSTTETPNITLEQKAALFKKVSGDVQKKLMAATDQIARDSRKQSEALSRAIAGVPARSRSRSSPSSSSKSSSRSSSDSPTSDSAASLDAELARLEAEVKAEKE
jgi:hypothetical protein